jgi:RNA polymerase sigma-70 factor (ECF subfamily)
MDSPVSDETKLVMQSQRGDKGALGELLRVNSRLIQSVSARLTHNPQLQEDIFQEVVIRVVRKIGEFKGNCKFSTWLYRITVNVSFSMLAKEGVHGKTVALDELPDIVHNGRPDIEETIDNRRIFKNAVSVIGTMSKNNREVFSMFYFADASLSEIAQQTGKSENAIKAILFKGRKQIMKHLKKNGLLPNP